MLYKFFFILIIFINSLFAHKVNLFGFYEDNFLYLEGFFVNGNPCKECAINIYRDKKVIFSDKLDIDGRFERNIELERPFKIILDASSGHTATLNIEASSEEEKKYIKNENIKKESINSVDIEEIRSIIRQELRREFEMLKIELSKNESQFEKVVSGIGYIFGIFGLWIFFKRK